MVTRSRNKTVNQGNDWNKRVMRMLAKNKGKEGPSAASCFLGSILDVWISI